VSDPHGFPHLAAPIEIRGVELRNRLVFQPHFTALPHIDGMPSPDLHAYHVERAWGGVGLIVDGGMAVMEEGKMSRRFLAAWDPAVIPLYRAMTDEVHEHGAKIFGQLTHGGHTSLEKPPHVMWAPTQMPEPSSNFSTKAMDARDIARVIDGFADATRNLLEAGFDGIEVKLAHDGLLRSFASPFFNRRTDAYGGSFEKRMRLPVEVIHAIKGAMPFEAPVGVRLCLHEYTAFGYDLDYGLRMAEHLEATRLVDYFNCDAGSFSSFWMEIPPAAVPQGFFRPLNQELKKITDLPVIAFGRIKRPDLAEHMISTGEADLIGMARQLIADPETPRKLLEGRAGEIRACIACNDACIHQVVQEKGVRCVQNPAAGQERTLSERLVGPAAKPKHVVVVGGGPAGMKVAEIASRRRHKVTLLERGELLGGQARLAARQPLHEEFAEVTAYLEAAIDRLGVDVWLNVEAEAEELIELEPDAILVATGSQPNMPPEHAQGAEDPDAGAIARRQGLAAVTPVPGLALDHVFSSDQVLRGARVPGERVLVFDGNGHWEAAGTAEFLADAHYQVDVITPRHTIGYDLEGTNFALFVQRCGKKGITLKPFTELLAIEPGRAKLLETVTMEEQWVEYDAVVPVYPRRSRDDIYFRLQELLSSRNGDVYLERIGDAAAPRLVQSVLLEAHKVGAGL
jgi:2,4-dienoyl-CoA reductase-like NADH-dependent reductase (Old Yellow Enzyme family)